MFKTLNKTRVVSLITYSFLCFGRDVHFATKHIELNNNNFINLRDNVLTYAGYDYTCK